MLVTGQEKLGGDPKSSVVARVRCEIVVFCCEDCEEDKVSLELHHLGLLMSHLDKESPKCTYLLIKRGIRCASAVLLMPEQVKSK